VSGGWSILWLLNLCVYLSSRGFLNRAVEFSLLTE
jgi:hypothetical protein